MGTQRMVSTFVLATAMCGCASHRVRVFQAALEGANAVKVPALVCIAPGQDKASFRVTVTDYSGAVVPDVRVEALRRRSLEAASPKVTRGRTNKVGDAVLNLDMPGLFDVLADAPGYEPSKVEMLSVAPGCTYPLNIQLRTRTIECPVYVR